METINRKNIKHKAKMLFSSDCKIIVPSLILYVVAAIALHCIFSYIPYDIGSLLNSIVVTPFLLGISYNFFIKGVYNNKFSIKNFTTNFYTCWSIVKLTFLIAVLAIISIIPLAFLCPLSIDMMDDFSIGFDSTSITMFLILILIYIIAFIYISINYAFIYYYLVDKNCNDKVGVFKSLKNSRLLIKGYRFQFIKFILSFLGLFLLTIFPFIIYVIKLIIDGYVTLTSTVLFIPSVIWCVVTNIILGIYFKISITLFYKELTEIKNM